MSTATKIRLKKELVGVVVSDKMDKTVIVRADRRVSHPLYDKVVVVSKKFVAHDEKNESKLGDVVRINQSRPLSKTKRWVVVETVRKNIHPDHHAAQPAQATETESKTKAKKAETKKVSPKAIKSKAVKEAAKRKK